MSKFSADIKASNITGYLNKKDLAQRYKVTPRTITRWVDDNNNPFPLPSIRGSVTLWSNELIYLWEEQAFKIASNA